MVAAPRKPHNRQDAILAAVTALTCPIAQHHDVVCGCRTDQIGERVGPRRCGSDERSPMKHQRLVRGAVGGVLHRHQHRGQVRARVVVAVLRRTIPRPAGFGIGASWASAARTAVASSGPHGPTWDAGEVGRAGADVVAGAAWLAPGRTRCIPAYATTAAATQARTTSATSQAVGQDPPGAGGVVSTSSDGWYAGAGQSGSISSDT